MGDEEWNEEMEDEEVDGLERWDGSATSVTSWTERFGKYLTDILHAEVNSDE